MTLEEMEEAGRRAESIRRLAETLATARKILDAVNKHGPGKTWNPELEIKPRRDNWSNDAIFYRVRIPFGVVQQAAVDEDSRQESLYLTGDQRDDIARALANARLNG